jgi:hypothetical protein
VITIESHGTFSIARDVNSCSALFSCSAAVATGLTASVDPRCQTQLWRALIKINLHHPKSSPIVGTTVGPHHTSVNVSSKAPVPGRQPAPAGQPNGANRSFTGSDRLRVWSQISDRLELRSIERRPEYRARRPRPCPCPNIPLELFPRPRPCLKIPLEDVLYPLG